MRITENIYSEFIAIKHVCETSKFTVFASEGQVVFCYGRLEVLVVLDGTWTRFLVESGDSVHLVGFS